ncbi:MAG TPA: hypothetical protein VGB07_30260, partial [Blastocatellia bacterium]
ETRFPCHPKVTNNAQKNTKIESLSSLLFIDNDISLSRDDLFQLSLGSPGKNNIGRAAWAAQSLGFSVISPISF